MKSKEATQIKKFLGKEVLVSYLDTRHRDSGRLVKVSAWSYAIATKDGKLLNVDSVGQLELC